MTKMDIILQNVSKDYPQNAHTVAALSDITLKVPSGEFLMLCGRSGSGKTTLLNLIGGIDQPTTGEIQAGQYRLHAMPEIQLARFRRFQVGFIFQQQNLIPTLTIFENVALPLYLTGSKAPGKKIGQLLERVGLKDKGGQFPDTLSGGEQQRAAIARALIHKPAIVLADEPTAHLDSATGDEIFSVIKALQSGSGTSVIFATHDTRLIEAHARVVELIDGRLA